MDWNEIHSRLMRARDAFLKEDSYLLKVGVSERALTAKFADLLRPYFPDWDVDPEFNRRRKEVKGPLWREGATSPDDVTPDILVHHRDTDDNLLVIEAKKTTLTKLMTD